MSGRYLTNTAKISEDSGPVLGPMPTLLGLCTARNASAATSMSLGASNALDLSKKARACDICRRAKRRCNGGERCARCAENDLSCTYLEPALVRQVYSQQELYVKNLETRLQAARTTIQEIHQTHESFRLSLAKQSIQRLAQPLTPPHPDDFESTDIAESFRSLSLGNESSDKAFRGQSSGAMLIKAAVGKKRLFSESPHLPKPWKLRTWEGPPPNPNFGFPDDELLLTLVSLYFSHVNVQIPLLHQPTFMGDVQKQRHLVDSKFAPTVLLVCAVGSLYSTDPAFSPQERVDLGWSLYEQVKFCGHSLQQQPTFYDLQAYCLAIEFVRWTRGPRACWTIIGFAMRLAHDMGAHRRKTTPTPLSDSIAIQEEKLEKRAFWILVFFDSEASNALGRAPYLDSLDFDVDLMEEWDNQHSTRARPGHMKQPGLTTTLSSAAFFNALIGLYRILNFIDRALYCSTAFRVNVVVMPDTALTMRVDAALTSWFSTVPHHLVWAPNLPDTVTATQSAALHCFYYHTRLHLHRRFITSIGSTAVSDMAVPNRDICVDAARRCIDIADAHRRMNPDTPLPFSQSPLFNSAMVLFILETSDPSSGTVPDTHIHTALNVLKSQVPRWPSSAFLVDVLERLLTPEMDPEERGPDLKHQWMPPAFVGDEEIRSRLRVHRPRDIPLDSMHV